MRKMTKKWLGVLAVVGGLVSAAEALQAQTGTVLAGPFVPTGAPCVTGNGRGMAFDGTDLYYTFVGNTNIFKIDTSGNCLGAIPVSQSQGTIRGGPLAWDGSALWTMNYAFGSFTLFRVNPADGSILSSCNIATQNPVHPAVTGPGQVIGNQPDGLDWTGSTLWVSSDAFANNWVVEVDTSCNILSAFQSAPVGGFGTSGVAFDGVDLWHPTVTSASLIQTDISGVLTGLSFSSANPGVHEDLACDGLTFPGKAALWGNSTANQFTAYEIPQCQKGITEGGMTGGGSAFDTLGVRVTHGFELHCDPSSPPNNLQVNWGQGNSFHLESLTSAVCADDPNISEGKPVAGFDTLIGTGTGRYNGLSGATARWTIKDAGEPGKSDTIDITIKNGAVTVLTVSGTLNNGNHQAHK